MSSSLEVVESYICLESFVKNERKIVHQKMAIPNPAKKRSCICRAPMELFLDHQEMSSSIAQSRNGDGRNVSSMRTKLQAELRRVTTSLRYASMRARHVIILGRKPTIKSRQTIFENICECNTIRNLRQCVLGKTFKL